MIIETGITYNINIAKNIANRLKVIDKKVAIEKDAWVKPFPFTLHPE